MPDVGTCELCGQSVSRSPYAPFDLYHYEGDKNFDHLPILMKKTLDEIMLKHGADKASSHPAGGHDYARHYDRFFGALRDQKILLLEIGVGSGNSHRGWLDYFPHAIVFGVDQVHSTNAWNTPGPLSIDHLNEIAQADGFGRYTFQRASQADFTFWKCLAADYPLDWTIIIDDGSHMIDDVVKTFDCAWPLVAHGGFYCIEDLGVGGTPGSVFLKPGYPTHMQFVHSLMERADVDGFNYANELAILRKK